MTDPGATDTEKFRRAIATRLGLLIPDSDLPALRALLSDRLRTTRAPAIDDYLALRFHARDCSESHIVAQRLGVVETHFLRDPEQLRAFVDTAVPSCLAGRARLGAGHRLRILSAGCASGEEPYSLAVLMHERLALASSFDIVGVDINGVLLELARRRRYAEWSFRQTPRTFRQRHFRQDGRDYLLSSDRAHNVTFEERNLLDEDLAFYWPGSFDIVFCRNVLMYFTAVAARAVVARLARALRPGGFLFLGSAETLHGLSNAFELRQSGDAFFYELRATDRPRERAAPPALRPEPPPSLAVGDAAASLPLLIDPDWVRTIMNASERIVALTGARTPAPPAPVRSPAEKEDPILARAMSKGDGVWHEPARLRLDGRANDPVNAEQRYLLALFHAKAGDRRAASAASQTAIDSDPTFALPHLHRALLAKAEGLAALARREFSEALLLLPREEAARLARFGGGFTRETLIRLCAAELASGGLQ